MMREKRIKPTSSSLSSTEYDALFDLYQSTNGQYWEWYNITKHSVPWNFSVPHVNPCTAYWEGLYCLCLLKTCHVTEIILAHHNLSGPLPLSIGNFTELTVLSLRTNNITGPVVEEIGNLRNLESLDLALNQLTGTIPTTIKQLQQVKQLNLNENFLTNLPDEIYKLSQLESLQLGLNYIRGTLSEDIELLSSLLSFSVQTNFLTGTIPGNIGNCSRLANLDLSFNLLTKSLPSSIYRLRNLTNIILDGNSFTGVLEEEINNWGRLKEMSLGTNEFFGSLPATFGELTKLQIVDLGYNQFSGRLPASMIQLMELQVLYLDENVFFGNLTNIVTLPMIQVLIFARNGFDGPVVYANGLFPNLQIFQTQENLLTGPIPWNSNWIQLVAYDLQQNYFTSSLPLSYQYVQALRYFAVLNNFLVGTLPNHFLSNTTQLLLFDSQQNLFTGTIPSSFGQFQHLSQLLLGGNFLTGTIPSELGQLSHTVSFAINNNDLTGNIPWTLLEKFPLLTQLSLQDNQLKGNFNWFLNTSLNDGRNYLQNVDISNNQFTGTLSSTFFQNTKDTLQSFAAGSNCFVLTALPSEICETTGLEILSLDGLNTAENCRIFFFPSSIYYLNGFTVSETIDSTIPRCLFEMPQLELLHLSGNGFIGTIPNQLNISSNLLRLALSYNILTGTIPVAIQNVSHWASLDLSYNKFRGYLRLANRNNYSYISTLTYEVNRLSGYIPAYFDEVHEVNILNGNIFYCNYDGKQLPSTDPSTSTYTCGSNTMNIALYVWLALFFVLPIAVGIMMTLFVTKSKTLAAIYEKITLWQSALQFPVDQERTINIVRFSLFLKELRLLMWKLVLFCILILLPLFCCLKLRYATYTDQYAWYVAGIFMSGVVPAALLLISFVMLAFFIYHHFRKLKIRLDERMGKVTRSSQRKVQDDLMWKENDANQADQPKPTELNKEEERPCSPLQQPQRFPLSVYVIVALLDVVLMTATDLSYVYVVVTYDALVSAIAAFGLALVRLGTNQFLLLGSFPLARRFILNIHRLLQLPLNESLKLLNSPDINYYSSRDISFLENLIVFNNIIIPIFSIILILPDCFYNALIASGAVVSVANNQVCSLYFPELGSGYNCNSFQQTTSFTPPYLYSYQCSAKIIVNYAIVYILVCLLGAMIGPCLQLITKCLYDQLLFMRVEEWTERRRQWYQYCINLVEALLPEYLRQLHSNSAAIDSSLMNGQSENNDNSTSNPSVNAKGKRRIVLFSKMRFSSQLNAYFAILISFGMIFPPLGLITGISIVTFSFYEEVLIGWLLTQSRAKGQGYEWYEEQINRECEGMDQSMYLTFWSILTVSCGLYGYIVFDIMGDVTGWRTALPISVCLLVLPFLMYLSSRIIGTMRQNRSAREESPLKSICETPMKGLADDSEVYARKSRQRSVLEMGSLDRATVNPLVLSPRKESKSDCL